MGRLVYILDEHPVVSQRMVSWPNGLTLISCDVVSMNLRAKGLANVLNKIGFHGSISYLSPKKPNEEALRKKYGGAEQYDKARAAFQDALKTWKGREDELQKQAFGFYEDFRPSIPPGQKGWGRKGQLRLQTVRDVVAG